MNKPESENHIPHAFTHALNVEKKWHEWRRKTSEEGGEEEEGEEGEVGGARMKDADEEQMWARYIIYLYKNLMVKPIIFYN